MLENSAHSIDINDLVVLECHLHKILPIFKIIKDASGVCGINDAIFGHITKTSCSYVKIISKNVLTLSKKCVVYILAFLFSVFIFNEI